MRNDKGLLIVEILITSAICVTTLLSLSLLVFQSQSLLAAESLKTDALKVVDDYISSSTLKAGTTHSGNFSVTATIDAIDNFTNKVTVSVRRTILKRDLFINLVKFITDTSESEGQSSCRPVQDVNLWKNPKSYSSSLIIGGQTIQPTDIDLVGKYAYITSDTSSSTDPDLIILDISDITHPVIVSSLDTGPGLLSLNVVGNYAYVGNTSINAQLQIIDISNKNNPTVVTSYKLPGIYNDATTVGNVVFYKAKKIFLGTQKSQIKELHVIDASSVSSPQEVASYEINAAVNDIFVFKDRVYVATPDTTELKIFSFVSNTLTLLYSYDLFGAASNGKRLSLFGNKLYIGRTVGSNELYGLNIATLSPPPFIFSQTINTSVQGILGYGKLLFVASTNKNDGFVVFDTTTTTPVRINTIPTFFSASPLNFDCDQNVFGLVFSNSNLISFITHS